LRPLPEFCRATVISIGNCALPPTSGLTCSSHSSLNIPNSANWRFTAPSMPTESIASFPMRGVHTVAGSSKNVASGPPATYVLI
jgi:hypothetical protein